VRGIALAIACDIHPLNNLRVLNYLTGTLGVTDAQRDGWYRYWVDVGLEALETRLAREEATGRYCSVAHRLGLPVSGGSDYHADESHGSAHPGSVSLPPELFQALRGRCATRRATASGASTSS
jgi:hypothetical protein